MFPDKRATFNNDPESLKRFLGERAEFVAPVDPLLSKRLNSGTDVELTHSAYRTHIYRKEGLGGKVRALVSANDPGALNVAAPLTEELLLDPRVGSVTLFVSGLANKNLGEGLVIKNGFKEIHPVNVANEDGKARYSIYGGLQKVAGEDGFDVVFTTIGAKDDPGDALNYGGLGVRPFAVVDGWGGLNNVASANSRNLEISAVFCNDALAEQIIRHRTPGLKADIYSIGTPVLDGLEPNLAEQHRRNGRDKLKIGKDALAFLYLGDVGSDYKDMGVHPEINSQTLEKTFNGVRSFARMLSSRDVTFMFRPHPRNGSNQLMYDFLSEQESRMPANMRVVRALGSEGVSMNEAGYTADWIGSIVSTESSLAPQRGREGFFLAFEDPQGLGAEVLRKSYGQSIMDQLARSRGVNVIDTELALRTSMVDSLVRLGTLYHSISSSPTKTYTQRMVDIAFAFSSIA